MRTFYAVAMVLSAGALALVIGLNEVQGRPPSDPQRTAPPPPTASLNEAQRRQLLRGRGGIYLRLGNKAPHRNADHPLVDAVILGVRWREVEPERGKFNFSALRAELEHWGKAGKGVVINLALYGQQVDDAYTPPWVYSAGVEAIAFHGGGMAKGRPIRIPKVWGETFMTERLEPLIAALAREFDADPRLWYVIPGFGHLGNITAQPSKDGASALRQAGWTPERWRHYCDSVAVVYARHFRVTPLIAKAERILIRDRHKENYAPQVDGILQTLGRSGISIITLGMAPGAQEMQALHARLAPLVDLARRGVVRLGMGDDWPLWVPEKRLGAGPTDGRDEAGLGTMLAMALGGGDGMPTTPITILFVQEPEIAASKPGTPEYRPGVYQALEQARMRLKANDAGIFGQ